MMQITVTFSEFDETTIAMVETFFLQALSMESVTTGYDTKRKTYEIVLEPIEEETANEE